MTEPAAAALVACRFHPTARQFPPVEVIVPARHGMPERREMMPLCMGCMAESKHGGEPEFAS